MNKWLETSKNKRMLLLATAAAVLFLLFFQSDENSMSQLEKRISQALSQTEGAGSVQVSIYYEQTSAGIGAGTSKPTGALAICEGAGDIGVRLRLTEALRTLLGLDASQVMVLEMEGD